MEIGQAVTFVDNLGAVHVGLVTNMFGGFGPENQGSINLVIVNPDAEMTDQYGRQIIRSTSVPHKSNQAAHGYYWF